MRVITHTSKVIFRDPDLLQLEEYFEQMKYHWKFVGEKACAYIKFLESLPEQHPMAKTLKESDVGDYVDGFGELEGLMHYSGAFTHYRNKVVKLLRRLQDDLNGPGNEHVLQAIAELWEWMGFYCAIGQWKVPMLDQMGDLFVLPFERYEVPDSLEGRLETPLENADAYFREAFSVSSELCRKGGDVVSYEYNTVYVIFGNI